VDTAHIIATPQTARENLYVAMTRGRHANTTYLGTDNAPVDIDRLRDEPTSTAQMVFSDILRNQAAEPSAHQAETTEREHWDSIPQWAAEYRTIAASTRPQQSVAEPRRRTGPTPSRHRQTYICGIIPEPTWPITPENRVALDELKTRIRQKAINEVIQAMKTAAPWLKAIGPRPEEPAARQRWDQAVIATATYRQLYGITTDQSLGPNPKTPQQAEDRARTTHTINDINRRPLPSPDQFGATTSTQPLGIVL
jgi:hypothetical protein